MCDASVSVVCGVGVYGTCVKVVFTTCLVYPLVYSVVCVGILVSVFEKKKLSID